MFSKYTDSKNLILIFIYCFIFLLLRIFCSTTSFTIDEAKQLFDSQDYFLGYSDQPPLFSWIIKTFSFAFGLNVPLMIVITHVMIFLFFVVTYFICKKFWNEKQSLIIVSSFVFIFLYSYDFYRYMIHSILITLIAALSLLIYLNLLKEKSLINYLLLGICFAAGILAKYNFAFFIFTIVLTSICFAEGRKVFFSYKTLGSIVIFTLLLSPHLLWLSQNNFVSVEYAMNRSESGAKSINYLKIFLETYWNHLLFTAIFFIFFFKSLSKEANNHEKQSMIALRLLAAWGILMPLIVIFILHSGNFTNRWASPLYLTLVLGLFTFVDFEKFKLSKPYFLLVLSCIFIIYGVKIGNNFYPDIFGLNFIHKPYKKIYAGFEKKLKHSGLIENSLSEVPIYSYKEQNIIAGIKIFYPQADLHLTKESIDINEPKAILIWDTSKFKTTAMKKRLAEEGYSIEKLSKLKAKYLYSKKPYGITVASLIKR